MFVIKRQLGWMKVGGHPMGSPEGRGPEEEMTDEQERLKTSAVGYPWHHHGVGTSGTKRSEGMYDQGKA